MYHMLYTCFNTSKHLNADVRNYSYIVSPHSNLDGICQVHLANGSGSGKYNSKCRKNERVDFS